MGPWVRKDWGTTGESCGAMKVIIECWVTTIESLRSTALEQIWAVPKFDEVMLSIPTPGSSSHPTRP
ncbi:hypothetical protein TNCV_1518201 [Trichonephila clavipes]|nr:hypothetical protein TNCV_1518201 [Trichonephila clavipes]